jgi:hypothetical protein
MGKAIDEINHFGWTFLLLPLQHHYRSMKEEK